MHVQQVRYIDTSLIIRLVYSVLMKHESCYMTVSCSRMANISCNRLIVRIIPREIINYLYGSLCISA